MSTTPGGAVPDGGTSSTVAAPAVTPTTLASPRGERWKLAAGWLVVGIPAAWGVAQVVLKSLALFR